MGIPMLARHLYIVDGPLVLWRVISFRKCVFQGCPHEVHDLDCCLEDHMIGNLTSSDFSINSTALSERELEHHVNLTDCRYEHWDGTHYNYVKRVSWCLKFMESWLFIQQLLQVNLNENVKARHYSPFVRENHRWPVVQWNIHESKAIHRRQGRQFCIITVTS